MMNQFTRHPHFHSMVFWLNQPNENWVATLTTLKYSNRTVNLVTKCLPHATTITQLTVLLGYFSDFVDLRLYIIKGAGHLHTLTVVNVDKE